MIRTRKAPARFLSALLCLVMMLTLLPTVAFAVTSVSTITGTVSDFTLACGATVNTVNPTLNLSADSHASQFGTLRWDKWDDNTNTWKTMSSTDKFSEGTWRYGVAIFMEDDYVLGSSFSVVINGSKWDANNVESGSVNNKVLVAYSPAYTVSAGTATLSEARSGVAISPTLTGYIKELNAQGKLSFQWMRKASGDSGFMQIPGATGSFYTPTDSDVGAIIYVAVWETEGKVVTSSVISNEVAVKASVGHTLNSVQATITPPTAGVSKSDITPTLTTANMTIDHYDWYYTGSGDQTNMRNDGFTTFEAGSNYLCLVYVKANSTYAFADDATGMVNGEAATTSAQADSIILYYEVKVGAAATAPDAPTGVTATAGDKKATVSFTPPANNGGAAITGYTVTATPGGNTATGASSPITVTGLANGVNYTFTVKATNSAGTSAASSASNSVKPMLKVELVDASIPAPKAGKTPYNSFEDGVGWVRWADTIIWTPYNKPFKSSTAYTATMEILADINSSDVFVSEFTADTEWKINSEAVTPDNWDAHSAIFTVRFPATKALDSISITTAPTTMNYTVGNSFNPAGMVVKATYEDDATQYPVTGYTVTDGASLSNGQPTVTISYTEGGVTKTTTQTITVTTSSKTLTGISVTTAPTKTTYTAGENFDPAGMVVTAAYSGAESATITGYTVTDGTALAAGTTLVTISYTENGVTKTTTQAITVNAAPAGLTFTDNASYDIPASKVGTAITPLDVSGGVNGGTAPYTFTAVNLPNGITISAAGTISGTPTTANAAETAVIKVTDNAGAVKTINIGVGKITNVPDAPTNVVAAAGNGRATVSFIPPTNDGGEAITSYTVTSSGGQTATGTGSPIVVTGLTNGTAYTFTVKATNSVGDSTASAPSNSVTPTTADTYGIALDTAGTYTFTAATAGYGAQTAKTVTVNSIGTAATGNLTVALSGTNAGSFTLNKTSISSIAAGGSDTFTIVPNTGLAAGTYTATVTVNGGAVTAQSFDVSFKVNSTGSGTGGGGTSYTYYTITATAGAGGSIAPSGSSSVREGTDKAYTITPNTGYVISDVLVDGKSVGAVKTYTFDNVKKAHTISVTFKAGGHSNPQTGVDMDFTDVKDSDWFYEDVAYVFAEGLMNGTSATTFSPYANTTRGMIVTILYRLAGAPAVSGTNPFDDVKPGSYYEDAITWAAANKIVGGYGNGKFGPDDNITREQMAAILYRYAQLKGYDVSVGEDTNILSYTDAESVGKWAIPSMQWACGAGLINGSAGKLMPQGEATRCQVAAILHRFCENIVK